MLLATRCLAGLGYGLLLAPIVYPLTRRLLGERSPPKAPDQPDLRHEARRLGRVRIRGCG